MAQRKRTRNLNRYERRSAIRQPFEKILVVCEGTKSEPQYFEGLRREFSLTSVTIKASREKDVLKMVEFAIKELKNYDKVFCVFDRDAHKNFQKAIDLAKNSQEGRKGSLKTFVSIPCFEMWVLLHFSYSTKAYVSTGKKSACEHVVKDLSAHIPGYKKSYPNLFATISGKLEQAKTNSKKLQKHHNQESSSSRNPSSQLHELVDYLQNLRKQPI